MYTLEYKVEVGFETYISVVVAASESIDLLKARAKEARPTIGVDWEEYMFNGNTCYGLVVKVTDEHRITSYTIAPVEVLTSNKSK